jgi:hypothetical protein
MFYGECYKCGERWELGTGSTCKCEAATKWVGLTMEEVYDIAANDEIDWPAGGHLTFARLIEAKLKEKNA